jgi:PKD repeat protein
VLRGRLTAALAALAAAAVLPSSARAEPVAVPSVMTAPRPAGLVVHFDASTSSAEPAATYQWDFEDDGIVDATSPTTTFTYTEAGAYTARLTVTDATGSDSKTISVAAQDVILVVPTRRRIWNAPVVVSGTVTPSVAGETVVIDRNTGSGWEPYRDGTTDAAGEFSISIPARTGDLRARASGGGVSASATLVVAPRVSLDAGRGRAFIGAPLRGSVAPSFYSTAARLVVRKYRRVVARRRISVSNGKIRTTVPTPGVGRFKVRLELPAADGLAGRTIRFRVSATARTVRVGDRGPDVLALHRRLARLHIHIPGRNSYFSTRTRDAVFAFQKACRLSRTGVVTWGVWARLGSARPVRPHFARPGTHIEIDKTRQIVVKVSRGRVIGVIHTSTGATGNTPLGRWRIWLKTPGYLPSGMYYSLFWYRGFAVHGYVSVPTYPASHGCARVPLWTAYWIYARSNLGERVYVYA